MIKSIRKIRDVLIFLTARLYINKIKENRYKWKRFGKYMSKLAFVSENNVNNVKIIEVTFKNKISRI